MSNTIIFHFNKKHLEDSSIPMWVIKMNGQTYYVNHVNVDKGIGFSTKETPDNPSTFHILQIFIINYNIMSKRKTTQDFIKNAIIKHGDKYDYSLVNYISNNKNIIVICKKHGEFYVTPNSHLSKLSGCPFCVGKRKTTQDFIKEAKAIHGTKYNYDKVIYENGEKNVMITCLLHGDFEQTPYTHKTGSGCSKCRREKLSKQFSFSNEKFIEKAKNKHGDKYDYSLVNYKNGKEKVKIICPKHSVFMQTGDSHIQGKGCPICKESSGEKTIRMWLIENQINFLPQYKFDKCVNKETNRKLPFDFYLPDFNMCIEYQGKQHFSPKYGGFGASIDKTLVNFNKLQNNDKIKFDFCNNNNIKLLTISFLENIIKKLENSIKIKGVVNITTENGLTIANITNI